jgi:hypothetical protein
MNRDHVTALPQPVMVAANFLPASFSPCFSHG